MPACPPPPARQTVEPYADGKWLICTRCGSRLRQVGPPKTRADLWREVEGK